jgi:hypothetical protein
VGIEAYEEVEATLLLVAEARERAERAGQVAGAAGGEAHIRAPLERTDRELLALHRRLLDDTIFHTPASTSQLALDAA